MWGACKYWIIEILTEIALTVKSYKIYTNSNYLRKFGLKINQGAPHTSEISYLHVSENSTFLKKVAKMCKKHLMIVALLHLFLVHCVFHDINLSNYIVHLCTDLFVHVMFCRVRVNWAEMARILQSGKFIFWEFVPDKKHEQELWTRFSGSHSIITNDFP